MKRSTVLYIYGFIDSMFSSLSLTRIDMMSATHKVSASRPSIPPAAPIHPFPVFSLFPSLSVCMSLSVSLSLSHSFPLCRCFSLCRSFPLSLSHTHSVCLSVCLCLSPLSKWRLTYGSVVNCSSAFVCWWCLAEELVFSFCTKVILTDWQWLKSQGWKC